MPTIELDCGPIDYVDTGGDGPVVVLTHGFPMDHRQWRKVLPLLEDFRCIAPTLPMGAHRTPVRPGTDLSHGGMAMIVADLIDALDLRDVTLVMNDWGGAQFVVALGRTDRIAAMALVACEAFDNFPPGPARAVARTMRLPGLTWLNVQAFRTPFVRHGQKGYGAMTKGRLPDDVLDAWFEPSRRDRGIRRDLRAFATGTPSRATLLEWAEALRTFDKPATVVWAEGDTLMPAEHGRRLAELLPQGRLVTVADSATLVPEDQPEVLAVHLRALVEQAARAA